VKVYINLDSDHPMADTIKDHVKERLEPLWDIKEVVVIFNGKV